jgi:hypothetical protein
MKTLRITAKTFFFQELEILHPTTAAIKTSSRALLSYI